MNGVKIACLFEIFDISWIETEDEFLKICEHTTCKKLIYIDGPVDAMDIYRLSKCQKSSIELP